jgi:hypothetical protein
MTRAEHIAYIKKNYLSTPSKRMAAELGKSDCFVRGVMRKEGLIVPPEILEKRKLESQFKKGQKAFNKGKKAQEYMSPEALEVIKKTQWSKDHRPHNHRSIGYIKARKDSHGYFYMYIKVADKQWQLLHRYNWQQAHGPIPKGYNVQFRDGNTENCAIENLYLVARSNQVIINKRGGKIIPPELQQTIILTSSISRKIKHHEKQSSRP